MTPGSSTRKDGMSYPDPAMQHVLTLVGTWFEDDPSWELGEICILKKIPTVLPYHPLSPWSHTTVQC
jgi:hypothetical protein